MALLTSTCQGALLAGWDADLQRRTLAIIFDGLRPSPLVNVTDAPLQRPVTVRSAPPPRPRTLVFPGQA